jgi:hypothetical protein
MDEFLFGVIDGMNQSNKRTSMPLRKIDLTAKGQP